MTDEPDDDLGYDENDITIKGIGCAIVIVIATMILVYGGIYWLIWG